ncbi:MAG TPA: DUF4446 family protein [Methylomusa anaerophila]|uniref:DUF4446 domain-containing protein n=1 Tax=Methylomusa anaerophila TaxID=1930071 RepID=A0A348AHP2_9FIRM|nr:DUF4446 family protein [Methylomusa anaerophila]BBB90590.1 hypothetical protein MAMMFC1_01244 [Methylomusa anaerophila]HML88803.1 DUF4446 family protein [Methylomusa anaerophila]
MNTEITEEIRILIINNLPYVILGITALIIVALIIFISLNIKIEKLNKRYRKMMRGMEGSNLEQLLMTNVEEVRQALNTVARLSEDVKRLEEVCRQSIQHVGIVRFNAFADTGSDLSFAIALLDRKKNGIIISSIYGRNESRIYAKPVQAGESTYYLSGEEKEALHKALGKSS